MVGENIATAFTELEACGAQLPSNNHNTGVTANYRALYKETHRGSDLVSGCQGKLGIWPEI